MAGTRGDLRSMRGHHCTALGPQRRPGQLRSPRTAPPWVGGTGGAEPGGVQPLAGRGCTLGAPGSPCAEGTALSTGHSDRGHRHKRITRVRGRVPARLLIALTLLKRTGWQRGRELCSVHGWPCAGLRLLRAAVHPPARAQGTLQPPGLPGAAEPATPNRENRGVSWPGRAGPPCPQGASQKHKQI